MSIYAAFNANGECLYVGQTTRHPAERWVEHAKKSIWALDAVRWESLPDLTEAAATRRLTPKFSAEANAQTTILGQPEFATIEQVNRLLGRLTDDADLLLEAHNEGMSALERLDGSLAGAWEVIEELLNTSNQLWTTAMLCPHCSEALTEAANQNRARFYATHPEEVPDEDRSDVPAPVS